MATRFFIRIKVEPPPQLSTTGGTPPKNPEHRRTLEFYAWFISAYKQSRLLDVGSGPGTVAVPLARLSEVASVVCFDSNPEARATLCEMKQRENLTKLEIAADGQPWALPFADSEFDVIVCRYALHHFSEREATLREFRRCLRAEGLLLYSDPAMPVHSRDATHGLYCVRESSFRGYLTYHETLDLLADSGFEVLAVRPYVAPRGTLDDYLADTDPEIRESLIRGWLSLDATTKRELKWAGTRDGLFISYPGVDIAAATP